MHVYALSQASSLKPDLNLELVLKVMPALVAVLAAAAFCGHLAVRLRQPRVLGEMVSGVLLGPTFLGALAPGFQKALFAAPVKPVLYVLSTLGLTLFMFLVGAGFDHGTGKGGLRHAGVLAVSGMVPSLLLGGGAGYLLYHQLSRPDISRPEFALFIGGALSITAFPMLARILYERGLQHTALGRMSLLGASIDDAAAWCFLAALLAVHTNSPIRALRTLGLTALFVAVMLLIVARLLRPLGRRVEQTGELGTTQLYVVIGIVLLAGYLTDYIGIYSVFGGFVAGLAMPRTPRFREMLNSRLMDVTCVLLLPIFFAYSGLNTKLSGITGMALLGPFLLILAAGFVGKYFGCAAALRAVGFSWRESYAVGGLMNARGLMILIFINIGLANGIITQDAFSLLALVAVVTTAAALPLFRLALPEQTPASSPDLAEAGPGPAARVREVEHADAG